METERPVTTASAQLFPPATPGEMAEAERLRADIDSNTIAGLQRLVLVGCRENQEIARRYLEDARAHAREMEKMAASLLFAAQAANDTQLQMQRDYGAYMEIARKPIQPRPTLAETAGHTVEHIVTELRKGVKIAFGKSPELQEKVQQALEDVVDKGKALVEGVVAEEPTAEGQAAPPPAEVKPPAIASAGPAVPPAPPAAPKPAQTYTKAEVMTMMDTIGLDFCERLFASYGIKEPADIKGPALVALHEAFLLLRKK